MQTFCAGPTCQHDSASFVPRLLSSTVIAMSPMRGQESRWEGTIGRTIAKPCVCAARDFDLTLLPSNIEIAQVLARVVAQSRVFWAWAAVSVSDLAVQHLPCSSRILAQPCVTTRCYVDEYAQPDLRSLLSTLAGARSPLINGLAQRPTTSRTAERRHRTWRINMWMPKTVQGLLLAPLQRLPPSLSMTVDHSRLVNSTPASRSQRWTPPIRDHGIHR